SGGTGNIGTDPLLTPDDHLSGGSPCINSGDPARDYGGQVDIDGESRVMNGRVDIGADEYSDTDVDGLSDFWELTHFGSLSADPNADPDGDGLPSIDEFGIYGSNPNAPPIRVPQELDTIQAGIDVADEGDTVLVAAGTYAGAGNTDLDFGGKAVVLYGPNGPAMTIIDCNDSARGFDFHSGETSATAVLGFTITRGFGDYGGAVRCDHSHPQIRECVFTDNTATSQGHNIYCVMSTPTLAGCSISSGAAASVADIWMQYGGARILGLIQIFDCNWVGSKLTLTGDGTVQMGPGAELNLDESLVFCNFVGPVNVQVGIGSELTIDGDAVIDLADPCDPNVRGTIDCNGLLLVKDNVQITNANINVMRARFEGHTSFTNNVITIDRWAPPGQFFIESDVTITYNDIYVNGDRYTELDPILFQGAFQHNRIFVTITEGVGTAQGGLFELRGEDGRADNNCPPEQYMCQVDPCTIPECNLATWTIEQMTFIPQAKLNLTNRFPFQAPFEPGSDYDVLYVKKLILGEESVLNTAYNRVYYETLEAGPNAVIKHVPLLGFSLINIAFDEVIEFIVRVTHNNFTHPADPNYNRTHIRRIEGLEPDPNGMMEMLNITVWDPNSPYCGQVVNARAKGVFAKAAEDQILVRFEYMFIEDPCDEAELVVYLSDKPELGENLVELARVRPSAPGRHGSVGSQDMAIFSGTFSGGDLNFVRGTYIELELCGTGARLWIDDWDPVIECYKPKCGDYGPDFGTINIIDYLLLVSEVGLSSPSSADKGCLDLICDGVVNNDDLLVWDVVERLHKCPMVEGAAATVGAAAGKPLGFDLEVPGADESASLVVLGKPQRSDVNDSNTPENCLYRMDANGACLGDSAVAAGNSRLVTDGLGNIYQIRNSIGIVRQDGTVVVEPGYVNDGNNVVVVGYCDIDGDYEEDGPLLSDAAFGACDPNIVYVVPVRVIPPEAEGCPYVAAAKLELTGGGNYNLLKLYGLNPVADPNQSRIPDCETVGSFVYEPDVQHLHEVEIDSYGNLFVLSFVICSDANNGNDNNWLLIYDEAAGNDSEVRVLLSDPGIGDPNLTAPTAMVVSSLEDKVYLASSARATDAEPNDLTAEVYRFSINRTGRLATGLTYDGRVDVICPEPNASVCSQYEGLCYENSAISTITSMVENPEDANLYVTGFTSPKFTELQWQSSQIEGFFTTPMLAVVTPDGNGPVHAVEISNCDPNGPLVLPLSVVWAGERHGGADLSHDGNVDMKDFSMLAQYWLASYCAGPDWCGGADLEPEDQPDGDVEMADLAVLVRHWLEIECAD
ncbi:MAG: choice-of-anchor Q domain-containing protein, partial [Planctomycetota bacterium]